MIRQIFIINQGGILIFSRTFVSQDVDEDLISGFLTALSSFAQEVKGCSIEKMEFNQFQYLYLIDETTKLKYILCIDRYDLIDEAKSRLELVNKEFNNRYSDYLKVNWNGDINIFKDFRDFVDKNLVIPPKIFIIGERGAGKTTIMDLFPGDTILSLDEDLNELIKKSVQVDGLELINQIDLWELDLSEIIQNSKIYENMLKRLDILLLVTESSSIGVNRTLGSYNRLKNLINNKEIYLIANKQDQKDIALSIDVISGYFDNIETYGISAIEDGADLRIFNIIIEILTKNFE